MRQVLIALAILLGSVPATAVSQVHVSIGINVPAYPTLQRVPGYPVYYAPSLRANYFFYDGLYWVFDGHDWYASAWYNGPWEFVDRFEVPVYVLRVPVRYYRAAPVYFRSWRVDAAPRWEVHWGDTWASRRSGWDRWDRNAVPAIAPLPTYQRQYTGSRYPQLSEQVVMHTQNYRYQPRDRLARQRFEELRARAPELERRTGRIEQENRRVVKEERKENRRAVKEERKEDRREARQERRVDRDERIQDRVVRERVAKGPPPHAEAKGWPGKGHERALERERPAPPEHAQAKGWPGKGHERAQNRERDDDHPGKGKGRDK